MVFGETAPQVLSKQSAGSANLKSRDGREKVPVGM
jgi:hypothetical protein